MNILDKEEFRVKLGQINKLVETQDYKGAMQIVDSIDWRRVKNVRTLCVVGEIYAANKRYEESKEIFLLAYHRAPIGKNILYRLIEVSLKMGQISEATEFFDEYREVAGNDNSQYILKYKIARAKNASLNEQIRILEEYKEQSCSFLSRAVMRCTLSAVRSECVPVGADLPGFRLTQMDVERSRASSSCSAMRRCSARLSR